MYWLCGTLCVKWWFFLNSWRVGEWIDALRRYPLGIGMVGKSFISRANVGTPFPHAGGICGPMARVFIIILAGWLCSVCWPFRLLPAAALTARMIDFLSVTPAAMLPTDCRVMLESCRRFLIMCIYLISCRYVSALVHVNHSGVYRLRAWFGM